MVCYGMVDTAGELEVRYFEFKLVALATKTGSTFHFHLQLRVIFS